MLPTQLTISTVAAADGYVRYFIVILLYHYFYYFRRQCPPITASRGNAYNMRKIIIISLFIRSRFIKLSRVIRGELIFVVSAPRRRGNATLRVGWGGSK